MSKHRLMLSAAAAALLATGVLAARADTEISTGTSTALTTTTSGNITVDSTGGIGVASATTPAVTINSNNFVLNNGSISNAGVDSAIGILIDTTAANIVTPATGFASTGTINLSGAGTTKKGIEILGGHTFYGPITLTSLTATAITGAVATTQASSLIIQGDTSAAFYLEQTTKVTSNILFGGGGISQSASANSTASGSAIVFLDGAVNGNVINIAALQGTGAGLVGLETLGGIHSCASDLAANGTPNGFTCPTSSGGSLINAGSISLIGSPVFNSRGGNLEAGSAVVIGGNIDGGFLNTGPGTSNNVAAAVISSSGIVSSGVVAPT